MPTNKFYIVRINFLSKRKRAKNVVLEVSGPTTLDCIEQTILHIREMYHKGWEVRTLYFLPKRELDNKLSKERPGT
jgi:hypothetical protein